MKSQIKILILLVLIEFSCKHKSTTIVNSTEIDVCKNRIETIQASTICKNVSYVQLSSGEGHLIGEVSKIIKTDKFYFILDAKNTKCIYAFNLDGTFFCTIGSNGRGPGEYLNPIDFVVDIDNEAVIVLDQFNKIIKIDYSGNLLVEQSLPKNAMFIEEIYLLNDDLFASTGRIEYNELNYQILLFDKSFNLKNHFLPYETGIPMHYTYKNKFFNLSGTLHFVDVFENNIYVFEDDSFILKYNLKLPDKNKTFEQVLKGNQEILNSQSAAYLFDSCVAEDSVLFLPILLEGRPHYGFLNIHNNDYFLVKNIVDDLLTFYRPYSYYKNKFISFSNSFNFNEAFPNSGLNVLPTDNPIIIEYQLDSL